MWGFLFSIIAGAAMSFQGVMNTRLSEKTGLFESNLYVQGMAFLLSLAAYMIMGKGGFGNLTEIPKQYMLGGILGLVITITVMLGIRDLSPTISISVILVSQLLVAALIDAFGLLGAEKAQFGLTKYVGVALMIGGVIVFKIK
jgi:transporter family-2 protein